jgi:DNA mismatch repair ATPase MutS
MAQQMRYSQQVDEWKRRLDALRMVLATTALLGDAGRAEFAELAAPARRLYKQLGRSGMTHLPGAAGYADWFALANVKHYFRTAALVFAERAFLQRCYLACGNLEADVALARHLLGRNDWCWSARGDGVALDGAVHPLMEHARALSLALDGKGAFLSGRNGVGKSTFLRTVGINLIVARAFGFCYATSAVLPALPVHASMRSEDSLLGGESLYLAELRRAKELLAASTTAVPGIFLVDEIFRGTNHLESVSAAAAVLDELASRALVLVSSHNLVLAPLLAHRLDPYFIARTGDGTLTLSAGVLAHTNGISLLADHGFGAGIERNAARVCAWLGAREVAVQQGDVLSWGSGHA